MTFLSKIRCARKKYRWLLPSGGVLVAFGLLAVFGVIVMWLSHSVLPSSHWLKRIGSLEQSANVFYMLGGVISAAAALLLSGVIVMAPLLSLALHQSHDPLVDLSGRISNRASDPQRALSAEEQVLVNDIRERLKQQLFFYRLVNPFYLAVWTVAVFFMAVVTVRFLAVPVVDKSTFCFAIVYLSVASILCVVFAVIAVLFFLAVRPGITKLEFYMRYLSLPPSTATPDPPPPSPPPAGSSAPAPLSPRRWFIVRALSLVFLLVVMAFITNRYLRGPSPTPPRPLRLAMNSIAIASAPVFVATDDTVAGKSRPAIKVQPFPSGRNALDSLLGGQADAATAAEFPLINASLTHPDIRIVMPLAQSDLKIVARRSSGIESIADLRGKRVATSEGTSADYFLTRVLQRKGLSKSDMTAINLQPSLMVSAITGGSVDAISTWEPHAASAQRGLGDNGVTFRDDQAYTEHFVLVTTEAVLKDPERRAALGELIDALSRAGSHIQTQPGDAMALVASRTGVEPKLVESVWGDFRFLSGSARDLVDTLVSIENALATEQHRKPRLRQQLQLLIDYDFYKPK